MSLSLMGTSKQVNGSVSALTLLTLSNKSSLGCILYIKILQEMKRMLDKLFISWLLQRIFLATVGPLLFLMCANWLYAKLRRMIHTNRHNKTTHALAQTLLAHPMTRCYTLINAGKINSRTPYNTIYAWALPCTCFLPYSNFFSSNMECFTANSHYCKY